MLIKALAVLGLLITASDVSLRAQESKVNTSLGVGMTAPVNPTGRFAGSNVNTVLGAGYNFDRHNSVIGEFMYAYLPSTRGAIVPISAATQVTGLTGSGNLITATGNYRFMIEGKVFGAYLIGGGGMYYRVAELSKPIVIGAGTPCSAAWQWWGYTCAAGFVSQDKTTVNTSSTVFGGNAGAGFTIRLSQEGYKFFVESRYHYAPNKGISTQLIAITFGIRW